MECTMKCKMLDKIKFQLVRGLTHFWAQLTGIFSKCRTWKGGSTHGEDALGGMAELLQGVLDAHAPAAKEKSHQSWLSKVFQVLFNMYLVAFISNEKKTQFKLSGKEQYGNRVEWREPSFMVRKKGNSHYVPLWCRTLVWIYSAHHSYRNEW